jgi:hypothetical protein
MGSVYATAVHFILLMGNSDLVLNQIHNLLVTVNRKKQYANFRTCKQANN